MSAVAVDLDIDTLESLDFEIICQATWTYRLSPGMAAIPACENPATHTANIHQQGGCQWIEKFICAGHLTAYNDACWECATAPRIKDCKHINRGNA